MVVILSYMFHDRITTIVILSRSYSITLHRHRQQFFATFAGSWGVFYRDTYLEF